jgi:hypothetical protein
MLDVLGAASEEDNEKVMGEEDRSKNSSRFT